MQMDFYDAIRQLVDGKRVTRAEWNDITEYCFLSKDGFLSIFRGGKEHRWLVGDGDILATDWVILNILN